MNCLNLNSIANADKNKKNIAVRFNLQIDLIKQSCKKQNQPSNPKFRTLTRTSPRTRVSQNIISTTDRPKLSYLETDDFELKIALDNIQQRGSTFLKCAFLNSEKKGKKRKIYGDFFNLKNSDMKGTMSIGQLWSNKQRSNYLKENKINVNKVKMVQKITNLRSQMQSLRKIGSTNSIMTMFSQTFGDGSEQTINSTNYDFRQTDRSKIKSLKYNLQGLRKELSQLHRKSQKEEMKEMMKTLQNQSNNMNKIEREYFYKMMEIL